MVALRGNGSRPMSRSLRIYQKIAVLFVVVSLLLLLAVLYLSISQATIRIVPNPLVANTNVGVEIVPDPAQPGQVSGFVIEQSFTKGREFTVSSEGGTPIEAKAHGTVTLINETGSRSDLVATTRVLSEEGVLFRLDEAVTIPANGQIEAAVSADIPGLSGEIGPTQFTIPGLSAALQSQIYAVSVSPMIGGVEYRRTIAQEDLDEAVETLMNEILEEGKIVLRGQANVETFNGESFTVELVEKTSDTEPGTEQGFFTISVTARVVAVFYDRDVIFAYAQSDLRERVPEGHRIVTVNAEGIQVEVQNVNTTAETANLNVYLDGTYIIASNNDLLDPEAYLGGSAGDVVLALQPVESIKEVSVSFTPFWLKRMPRLEDHIRVIIESEGE